MIVVVPCDTTGYQCISACDGQPDGDYQWCRSCNNFISCWNYNTYVHVCEEGLVYDSNIKRCAKKSDTCMCSYGKCRFVDTLAEIVVVMQFCVVVIKIILHGTKVIEFDMFEMYTNGKPNSVGVMLE